METNTKTQNNKNVMPVAVPREKKKEKTTALKGFTKSFESF